MRCKYLDLSARVVRLQLLKATLATEIAASISKAPLLGILAYRFPVLGSKESIHSFDVGAMKELDTKFDSVIGEDGPFCFKRLCAFSRVLQLHNVLTVVWKLSVDLVE